MNERTETLDRNHPPTPTKLRRLRSEGVVPRSAVLTTTLSLLGGGLVAAALAGGLLGSLRGMMAEMLSTAARADTDRSLEVLAAPLALAAGVLGGTCLASIGAAAAQGGLRAKFSRLAPDPGRCELFRGLRRMVSVDAAWRLALTAARMAALLAVGAWTLWGLLGELAASTAVGPGGFTALLGRAAGLAALRCGAVLLAAAGLDVLYQRHRFLREHRMSDRELREEIREQSISETSRRRRGQRQERPVDRVA